MISLIIPVWGDYEKYLDECLESVEKQTYRDFEVVISRKNTLPSARNDGISRSKGEYILPLDVDDLLSERFLEMVTEKLKEYDVVTTGHKEFGYHFAEGNYDGDFSLEGFKKENKLIACSAYRREKYDEIGGYDEAMTDGYEDWDFWIRMAKAGARFYRIPEILYFQRKHGVSMSYDMDIERLLGYLKQKHSDLWTDTRKDT